MVLDGTSIKNGDSPGNQKLTRRKCANDLEKIMVDSLPGAVIINYTRSKKINVKHRY